VIDTILALMDELKDGTIETMLAKSDLEVGLEMLTRLARASGTGEPHEPGWSRTS